MTHSARCQHAHRCRHSVFVERGDGDAVVFVAEAETETIGRDGEALSGVIGAVKDLMFVAGREVEQGDVAVED